MPLLIHYFPPYRFDALTTRAMFRFCHLALILLALPCAGLSQINPSSIDIVRDSFGVPHIFAKTDAEVAYGLAWAHCEDDFATVPTCFLAAKGLLGRVKGKAGVGVDYVVQAIRARELAEEKFATSISPDFQRVLQGYCDGFNRFAQTHPKEVMHRALTPTPPPAPLVVFPEIVQCVSVTLPLVDSATAPPPVPPAALTVKVHCVAVTLEPEFWHIKAPPAPVVALLPVKVQRSKARLPLQ